MDYAEVDTIRKQFQGGQWPQFLQMVAINGLRGWTGQAVEFNFPVVAIVGENGSGKSTLLKAATCVYDQDNKDKKFFPSAFFVDTHWDAIKGVTLSYRVKRGPNIELFRVSKPTKRWRDPDNPPKRNVYLLEISRTLPLDASAGYAKIARSAASEIESDEINDEFRARLSHVLGRTTKKRDSPPPTSILEDRLGCWSGNGEKYLNFTRVPVKTRRSICSGPCRTFQIIPFSLLTKLKLRYIRVHKDDLFGFFSGLPV